MSILITGGNGLVGSEINIVDSYKPSSKELNILDYNALCDYIKNKNIKKIIHCAAIVGGVHANNSCQYDFFIQNCNMNLNIIRVCKEFKLHGSIFILSTCIFPDGKDPYREEDLHDGIPHNTNYGYAYAKRILDIGSQTLFDQFKIKTHCLIPCNLYGKKDNYNLETAHVLPSLIHKCFLAKKTNSKFTIWGNGIPIREFIYAQDFARIIELINLSQNAPQKLIISPGSNISIQNLAQLIADRMNYRENIIFDKTKPNGIFKKNTDNSKFRSLYPNFKFTSLNDGLDEVIKYFEESYPNVRL